MAIVIQYVKCNVMTKKILIVDDNEFMVEVMSHILLNKGYDVIALYEGNAVIDHIRTDHPDLVILDMQLPDADGRDICKEIKLNRETKNLPVILCTGNEDFRLSIKRQESPDDVLHKPFDVDSLVNMVAVQLAA
ncbi:response regulator [Mucilaginibacter corticis]|uniref:Response regulator n=2 Tax=Mucilaginibacter corticis TaxID=2597670 RepID=A0A556MU96_9SPHI|nr:response regulator [Mucilaginibacter corticis]